MKEHQTQSIVIQPASKKAYRSPELVVYGDVRQMTQTVGVTGMTDGGMALTSKTSA